MDLLIFERYGLKLNETNPDVIEAALEKSKAESKWIKNLNAKNDKIRSKAKEEQARWNEDKVILTDSSERTAAAESISKTIEELVAYINEHSNDEERFDNAVSVFIEWNLKAEDIKRIYEKYKTDFSSEIDIERVNEAKKLARNLAKPYGGFVNIKKNLDDSILSKFYEMGIDLTDFSSALKLNTCSNCADVIRESEAISAAAYDIYNRKLIKDTDKNAFMDVFSSNSNSANSLVKVLQNEPAEAFSFADWAVMHNIPLMCRLMDSSTIGIENLYELPAAVQKNFSKAMEHIFGVKFKGTFNVAKQSGGNMAQGYTIPTEVKLGEAELKKSEFDKAEKYFRTTINNNPYCWQGYWGLFKAKINATDDENIYFPGFIEEVNKKARGEQVDEAVELFLRAKEIAVQQQARDINFFNIEKRYIEADEKEEQFIEYSQQLSTYYERKDERKITNPKYITTMVVLKKIAEKFNKHYSYDINYSVLGNIVPFLMSFGFFTSLATGIYYSSDNAFLSSILDPLAQKAVLIMVVMSLLTGIASAIAKDSKIIGAIICVPFFISMVLVDGGFGKSLLQIYALLTVAMLAIGIFKIVKIIKVKSSLKEEKKQIEDFLIKDIYPCYIEDLTNYYNSNELMKYGIALSEDYLVDWNMNSYFFDNAETLFYYENFQS